MTFDSFDFLTSLSKIGRRAFLAFMVCAASAFSLSASGAEMKLDSPSAILHELDRFRQMGSVLYIAAHPDDENTELLAYLARGRDYRTAYLSLTRGDGGQNVLGPDIGEKLGVARTHELLAAREIDGAQQFFSRAVDFGFSKSYLETLKIWDKKEVVSDIVRVIREFHPDILVTRFSPSPGGTHGHHTASAVLALEAFKLAGDPKAFPEQGLPPWQPKRIFWNISKWQLDKVVGNDALKIDAGGKDAVSGESFVDIASKSRAMHKTQGFDSFKIQGAIGGARPESFQLLDGEPASKDILDGIDSSWSRVPGGAEVGKLTDSIIAKFNQKDVQASVPDLLQLRSKLEGLQSNDLVVKEKQLQLDRIIEACVGLHVETTISQAQVVPGEKIELHHSAIVRSNIPVKWLAVRYPSLKKETSKNIELHANQESTWTSTETLPESTQLTQPWWLRKEGSPGIFGVEDPSLIGSAENGPSFPIENVFEVAGQKITVFGEPLQVLKNAEGVETRRRMDVIPPVSLRFISQVALFSPGASRSVEVEIKASRANSDGTLSLTAPDGWKISPAKLPFHLKNVGQHQQFKFTITSPKEQSLAKISANAEMHGQTYHNQHIEINYAHLPPQLLQPPATMTVSSFEIATRGHVVGYLPGAGDTIAENVEQLGYTVKKLDDAKLTAEQLQGLDAVIIGVRAFNVRNNIGAAVPLLFDYVKNGGTVITQYNRPDGLKAEMIAPYDLHISSDRCTDEKAPITFLAPDNVILNKPNKISSADFDNWVQERGLYFANKWDEHFTPLIACNDDGEAPMKGSLLVAKYGKGNYIYTGLSFFRQLPAGVPGAYRLLANLISIDK